MINKQTYLQGFTEKCAEYGVDPQALTKSAGMGDYVLPHSMLQMLGPLAGVHGLIDPVEGHTDIGTGIMESMGGGAGMGAGALAGGLAGSMPVAAMAESLEHNPKAALAALLLPVLGSIAGGVGGSVLGSNTARGMMA